MYSRLENPASKSGGAHMQQIPFSVTPNTPSMQQFLGSSVQEIDFYTHCCSLVAMKTLANGLYLPLVMSPPAGVRGKKAQRAATVKRNGENTNSLSRMPELAALTCCCWFERMARGRGLRHTLGYWTLDRKAELSFEVAKIPLNLFQVFGNTVAVSVDGLGCQGKPAERADILVCKGSWRWKRERERVCAQRKGA